MEVTACIAETPWDLCWGTVHIWPGSGWTPGCPGLKGLVERSVSGTDARQRVVALTPAGLEREAEVKQSFLEAEALIARGLTEEETNTLRSLLERVIHNLEEDRNL